MKHLGNVTKINGAGVEPVDIITFGAPCQDLSVAGRRSGLKHVALGDDETTRSGLFFEAIRIIKEMREATNNEYPKYAVYENVSGAFSSNKGNDFHAVLEALCSVCDDTVSIPKPYDAKRTKLVWNKAGEIVGDNYSIAWRTLDAQYWGVPQRRKRIYLVADFTGRCAGEILFKQDRLHGNHAESGETRESVTADAVGGIDGSNGNGGQLAATLISSYGTKWNGNAGAYNGENFVLQKHSVDGSVGVECITTTMGSMMTIGEELAPCIRARDYKDAPCVVYSFDSLSSNSMKSSNPFSGCRAVEVAKCIDTTYPDPSKNQGGVAVVVLNDQGGSSINVESEETSPTLRANSHQHEPVIAFAQNQRDEVRDLGDKAGALAAEAGVHQQTYVAQPVIALQANGIDRADTAGCNGCGWRENESYTLNTVDRHAVCYPLNEQIILRHGALGKNTGFGAGDDGDPAYTLQANHPHAVCYGIDQQGGKGGANYSENTMPPMCSDSHGTPHAVCFEPGAMLRDMGNRAWDEQSPTIRANMGDNQPAVCYDARGNGDGETACYTMQRSDEYQTCNVASTQSARQYKSATDLVIEKKRRYIIRRLTPTECARLQGFPDDWGHLAPYNPADAEFWEIVRKTHAEINGKVYKPVKNLKRWYDKLHTDSAEYKAYGNGLALPCAEFVVHGIAEQGAKTLGSLFDGIGGFPLAGVLNGIKPVWASEVEPYCIAVTVGRFCK